MFTGNPPAHLAAWLAANRIRLLDALAAALDTDVPWPPSGRDVSATA
jgi:hypothetical protein